MKEGKKSFLFGAFLALALGLLTMDPGLLEAVARKVTLGVLPRELRMAVDLGVLKPSQLQRGILDAPISRREFGFLLKDFLKLVGAPAGYSSKALQDSGVLSLSPARKALSRQAAAESLCRALIHLSDVGITSLDGEGQAGFPDYAPPPKYQPAMRFLRGNKVIRGYPDGSLHAARAITTREAVYFLYRLYEQVASRLGAAQSQDTLHFVDLPLDHPIVAKVQKLKDLGAFDQVNLGRTFDGDAPIKTAELMGVVTGILGKAGKPTDLSTVAGSIKGRGPSTFALRRHLAILAGHLVATLDQAAPAGEDRFYSDVRPDDPEFAALSTLEKKGIHLGYSQGKLAGNERITWFETIGVLNAVLDGHQAPEAKHFLEEPAQRSDFEEFAAMIKAKKERIRNILDRKPRYKRS